MLIAIAICCQATRTLAAPKPRVIEINAIGGFRYDVQRMQVKPGETIQLQITNADTMMHNLAIVKPGTRDAVVQAATELGSDGPELNYVPKIDAVLAATPVVAPGQTATIRFTVPKKVGIYPYVCTYPGHGFVMYGALYVGSQTMPPLDKDPNLPPPAKKHEHGDHSFLNPSHGAKIFREFMPNSGPASIAVGLPMAQSLCFDAGQCRVRYAWAGGFVTIPYRKHDQAKLVGEVYFRADANAFPLVLNADEKKYPTAKPTVRFQGYHLIHGYPQFQYTVDGTRVRELIQLKSDGRGIVRTFEIDTDRPVQFVIPSELTKIFQPSTGAFKDGVLSLTAKQARRFSVTMTGPGGHGEEDYE